jgi:hypothetical protein
MELPLRQRSPQWLSKQQLQAAGRLSLMNWDGMLGFERDAFGREIQVRLDDSNGSALSTKVTVPVSTFQNVLHGCNALDEGTIGFFDAMALQMQAVRGSSHIQPKTSVKDFDL